MKVLGIDPGTLNLGWGFIEADQNRNWKCVAHDSLHVSTKTPFYERLHILGEGLSEVLELYKPDVAVIEKIFLGKSVDSAFKLGHIRGVCAAQCQAFGVSIVEYSPRSVMKPITGSGSAEKEVVRQFLYQQLGVREMGKSLDATDALALAFCHFLQDSVSLRKKGVRAR